MRYFLAWELRPTKTKVVLNQNAVTWPDEPVPVTANFENHEILGSARDFRREMNLSITCDVDFEVSEGMDLVPFLADVEGDMGPDGILEITSGVIREITLIPRDRSVW